MHRSLPVVLALLLVFAGCSDNPNPMQPSTLTVGTPTDLVFIGDSATLTALWGAQDVAASADWSVEGTAFHVESPGVVRADHSGAAQIDAKYQGILGRVALRALPNMQGHFVGQYIVDSCAETGSNGALCALPDGTPPGTVAPFDLTFTQSRESVTGTIAIGGIVSAPFTTSISTAGAVMITLSGSDQDSGTFLSETFSLSSETPGRIDGIMTLTITNSGASVDVGAHLANVVRQ
jgi:hypothetical protein